MYVSPPQNDPLESALGFAARHGYYDSAKQLIAEGNSIASVLTWNEVFEERGLLGLLQCIPQPENEQTMRHLALMVGYAVLQHIERSYTHANKLKDSESFTKEFLAIQLTRLEKNEIEPSDIGPTIQSAIAIWKIEGIATPTKWDALREFMDSFPFTTSKLTVQDLLVEHRAASETTSSFVGNISVGNQALCVLSAGAQEALCYMPKGSVSKDSMKREFGSDYAHKLG